MAIPKSNGLLQKQQQTKGEENWPDIKICGSEEFRTLCNPTFIEILVSKRDPISNFKELQPKEPDKLSQF